MPETAGRQPDNHRAVRRHGLLLRKHLRRNFLIHSIEGGLHAGGLQFRAEDIVLPVMVATLGGPSWLIGLVPILARIGYPLPPLFMAHVVERLKRQKTLVLVTGFAQRLPFLLAGLALVLLPKDTPGLAVWAVAACPLLAGLAGGFGVTAWQEMVATTVPPNRRSSLWAIRSILASLIGVLAGYVIAKVMGRYGEGNAVGYGVLHLIAFGFVTASIVLIGFIHETPYPRRPSEHSASLWRNLSQMPAMIAGDRRLALYLAHNVLWAGLLVALPFLSIHALSALGKREGFVGTLLAAQMIGQISGNLLAGWTGDRLGGKVAAVCGEAATLATCIWTATASTAWEFCGGFLLLGAGQAMSSVGLLTLSMELCPVQRRSSYLAVMSALPVPSLLAASQIGSGLWRATGGNYKVVAGVAACSVALAMAFLVRVREPRAQTPLGTIAPASIASR